MASTATLVTSNAPIREAVPFTMFERYEVTRPGYAKKRLMKFTFNALADFEQEVGMGFGQLMQMKATFATARALVWAGLKHEDRALTIEYVGERLGDAMVDGETNIGDIIGFCMEVASKQGALGRMPEGVAGPGEVPTHSAEGNGSPAILDVSPVTVADGLNGFQKPNPSDSEL